MRTGLLATIVAALLIGFPLAGFAGTVNDDDGDGIDDSIDNCVEVANGAPDNCDTDQDGIGNFCDADINNNGFEDGADIPDFLALLADGGPSAGDMNCNGFTDGADIPAFLDRLNNHGTPGPSGLACAGTVPCP